jgi:hypothetical protein
MAGPGSHDGPWGCAPPQPPTATAPRVRTEARAIFRMREDMETPDDVKSI